MTAFFSRLFPRQGNVTHRERWISGLGGLLAILVTALVTHHAIGGVTVPYMIAAMGASTVLLLGVPHSPLAQPWAFFGGHLVSALIGVTCATYVPDIHLAAGMAVGLSITAMYYLRCIHPPGGATALLTVIGDQKIHDMGYGFVLMPVLANAVILLAVALVINRLIPGRQYPASHAQPAGKTPQAVAAGAPVKLGFNREDLLAALAGMDGFIDVSDEDLERIYGLATLHAHQRELGKITVADIMTRSVVTIRTDTALEEVWARMRDNGIRATPVLDKENQLAGMVSMADFLKMADWKMCDSIMQRIRFFVQRKKTPMPAQCIMSSPVITLPESATLIDAFLIFAEKGINHLPILGADGKMSGIITRLNLLAALYGDYGKAEFQAVRQARTAR